MNKSSYFRLKGTTSIKNKKHLKKNKLDIPNSNLEEWFKIEEEKIRTICTSKIRRYLSQEDPAELD